LVGANVHKHLEGEDKLRDFTSQIMNTDVREAILTFGYLGTCVFL